MQIKRFEAKNMTDALRQIKRELGPEAVILSAKDLRRENRLLGISRKIGVEVTAAVDEDYPGRAARPMTREAAPALTSNRPQPNVADEVNDVVRLRKGTKRFGTHHKRYDQSSPSSVPALPNGDDRPAVMKATNRGPAGSPMGRHLEKSGLSVGTLALKKTGTTWITLVGNAGVGKTSTIAKLAANFTYIDKVKVGLLSLDGRRIGGLEHLQCFADSMHLPMAAPGKGHDLSGAMARLESCRVVLVDTPAVNPDDGKCLTVLQSQINTFKGGTTLLAVSAECREEDLVDTVQRYDVLKPAGVVITKTDLTRSYRDLVNFLCRGNLDVFFYSDGPKVPFDLKQASIEELARRFLQREDGGREGVHEPAALDAMPAEQGTEEHLVYLANKSSDIFHRPDCKWIRLINRANIKEFTSFAEALNHRYKPCRYCNPQHISITGLLSRESAAL